MLKFDIYIDSMIVDIFRSQSSIHFFKRKKILRRNLIFEKKDRTPRSGLQDQAVLPEICIALGTFHLCNLTLSQTTYLYSWVKTRGVVTIFTMTKCFTGFIILRYYSSK